MKHYYLFALLLVLGLGTTSLSAQEQLVQEQTFVKVFNNVPGVEEVMIDIAGDVHYQYWDKPIIRTILTVEARGITRALMKDIVITGRYRIKGQREGNCYELTANQLGQTINLNGHPLPECYHTEIFIPRGMQVDFLELKAPLADAEAVSDSF